ncbi:MAG TPA: AAA family ATPase [Thermoanaerobacterales bacterium]|nr:AAA family ATPase [Thermoanaerobacterales bacterium]
MGGSIVRYFPGGNTPNGYISLFERIIPWSDAKKIIIIKGGPGVGKSSFMKIIAKDLLKQGFNLEFLHCSADNGSIDGLLITDLDIILLDGTAPHMMDPKYPGCIDEIINLGNYWNEDGIRQNREQIISLQNEISVCYKRAYNYLKAARIILDDLKQVYNNAIDVHQLNDLMDEVVDKTFEGASKKNKISRQRNMFASAITHDGPVHYLDSLFWNIQKRFIVTGFPGTGKSVLMKKIVNIAVQKGLDVDVFLCPMEPEKIEHIIIKDLNVGFVTSVKPHVLTRIKDSDELIDFNKVLVSSKINGYEEVINYNNSVFWDLYYRAVKYLDYAKKFHDELERYYVANMDFNKIDEIRDKTFAKILKYAYAESYSK